MDLDSLLKVIQILAVPVIMGLLVLIRFTWTEAQKSTKEVRDAGNLLRDKFQAFEVKVASEYVHIDRMKDLETRILNAIQRLEEKMDKREVS